MSRVDLYNLNGYENLTQFSESNVLYKYKPNLEHTLYTVQTFFWLKMIISWNTNL